MNSYYIIAETGNIKIRKQVDAPSIKDAIAKFIAEYEKEINKTEETHLQTISFFVTKIL
ncbi:MAG: hypothetical protein ACYDBV_13435 [Nitrospiria bacterium]